MTAIGEKAPAANSATTLISKKDLPLFCPRSEDSLWNGHPRVYLPLEKPGDICCPYCGARYRLEERE